MAFVPLYGFDSVFRCLHATARTAILTLESHFQMQASCLFSAWINTRMFSGTAHPPTQSFSALPPRVVWWENCLFLLPSPPSLKVNPQSSDSHVFLRLGSWAECLDPCEGQACWKQRRFRRKQNKERGQVGPRWLGCCSSRWCKFATGCSLSSGWCFSTFTRLQWMDGLNETRAGSTSRTRLPFIPLKMETALQNEKLCFEVCKLGKDL